MTPEERLERAFRFELERVIRKPGMSEQQVDAEVEEAFSGVMSYMAIALTDMSFDDAEAADLLPAPWTP